MKNLHYGHCIVGIALVAGLLFAFGVRASSLPILAIVILCPLMMFMMMRMMMGSDQTHPSDRDDHPAGHHLDR